MDTPVHSGFCELHLKRMRQMIARLQILVLGTLFLAACSHDPNVRKQKYLESGERYFAKAEYSAASAQFRNALQVDPQMRRSALSIGSCRLEAEGMGYRQQRTYFCHRTAARERLSST